MNVTYTYNAQGAFNYRCDVCGSLVGGLLTDQEMHTRWHQSGIAK